MKIGRVRRSTNKSRNNVLEKDLRKLFLDCPITPLDSYAARFSKRFDHSISKASRVTDAAEGPALSFSLKALVCLPSLIDQARMSIKIRYPKTSDL